MDYELVSAISGIVLFSVAFGSGVGLLFGVLARLFIKHK